MSNKRPGTHSAGGTRTVRNAKDSKTLAMADADAHGQAAAAADREAQVQQLAKMPSGEPISSEFLSSILGGPPIVGFRVDGSSVIQGRHSTTFRLLIDRLKRQPSPGGDSDETTRRITKNDGGVDGGCNSRAVGGGAEDTNRFSSAVHRKEDGDAGECWANSVFVKRMVCSELPARSLAKWR